jgi:hypothetical protein
MIKITVPLTFALALTTVGCATTGTGNVASIESESASRSAVSPDRAETAPPAADRQAILAMAGEYVVTFAFDETVPLTEGYDIADPKRSGASEAVVVVEDTGDRIVLQHMLLMGEGKVIKHWRQDWVWQADHRLEFVADQTWRRVALSPDETSGQWTQCVYGVADAPRYCGTGDWNHRYGQATWTSDRTWRPLPRREYTKREDYNALNVENRHTITPTGWTHEQDNSKVVRDGERTVEVLVREFGFNHYRRTSEVDFTPVYDYWDETRDYWARVRETWEGLFASGGVRLATEVDARPIIDGLFERADAVREGEDAAEVAIAEIFDEYVRPLGTALVDRN